MVNYRRFWDRDTLSVSHFLLWTAAAATYLSVAAAAGGGKARVRTSTDITLVIFNQYQTIEHWGLLVGPNLLDARFDWDKHTKNIKPILRTKLTPDWSPSKALTLPYESPLGKVGWDVMDPDNRCTKAFMRLKKLQLKKGYKEIGGNCMDSVKGALKYLGKMGCVEDNVMRKYMKIYEQDYARVRKAVFEERDEREMRDEGCYIEGMSSCY
ncbi:uncharacterized protein C8R40DRAFT_1075515, partial [Lentinula edodes]|uniref:uncharacterized protein n=1 Tax=Lentinula edodes TaxID=5353 RepID=UPI001E8DC871